jgi:hypothetical protein
MAGEVAVDAAEDSLLNGGGGVEMVVDGDGENGCSAWQHLAAFLDEKEGRVRGRGQRGFQ